MPVFNLDAMPEVFVSTTPISKAVAAAVSQGKLRKLGSRLYTKNMAARPETLVRRNWPPLVKAYFPDALIADRTALENKIAEDGSVFIISEKRHGLEVPGLKIRPRKGPPPLDSDLPFVDGLRLSSTARAYLENLLPSRSREGAVPRTLSRAEVEEKLDLMIRTAGEEAVNRIRDDARRIAPKLGLEEEFEKLNKLIGHLLGTREGKAESAAAKARAAGRPIDPRRVELFGTLFAALRGTAPVSRIVMPSTPEKNENLSFFEAYFSNFIEGTEFEIDEAADIVFNGKIPPARPADAHDILGTFRLVSDPQEMSVRPRDFGHFLTLLQARHFTIMEARPEKQPGIFKSTPNRAGSTQFVDPSLVEGTLEKGFEIYRGLEAPLHRAIFMMFLVSEVHPFSDGNGRLARVMMNAELAAASEEKIIIPTIYRQNYINALKALSSQRIPEALIRTLDFAQKYTQSIDWSGFDNARRMLQQTNAFTDSAEADRQSVRLVLPA